ncbi:MAG: BamA/TamA family outer membrane protein, partial [Fulvivirga sp.]|nr:BamA/TamA family outer membrane protein [Fulvivirga sp.]
MRSKNYILLLPVTLLLLSGCLGTKYLKEDEKLLYKQKIKASDELNKDELRQLYVQETNRRFPIIPFSPYVWFYYHGLDRYSVEKYKQNKEEIRKKYNDKIAAATRKKKKLRLERKKRNKVAKQEKNIEEGNVWMRWGEPLAVFDPKEMSTTEDRLLLYLRAKGYFNATVTSSVDTTGKKVAVTYRVKPGNPYKLDTIFHQTTDSAIYQILENSRPESFLKKGKNYDQSNLTAERERIDLLLKDHGYFDFSRQYVVFDVDTTYEDPYDVAIRVKIKNPSRRGYHKVFHVDSIIFVTDANVTGIPDTLRQTEYYDGISFRYFDKRYNKKILSRRVFIEKDSLYNKSNTFDTQRQLANLDMFRFINIKYDSVGGQLVANIFTSPLSRYQWSNEVGINVTQGFPGPFYNVSFKKRNVFRGLENFEINGRIGIEGVAPATEVDDVYSSIEAGANASLTFPQFILPISGRAKQQLGKINPKTRLQTGYTYTDRPEYSRQNFNFKNTYSWQKLNRVLYQFTVTDVSLINSELSGNFTRILEDLERNGNRLINSFRPSFVSSMHFSASWNFNQYGFNFTNASFLRVFIESGGTSLNFVGTDFLEKENLEYYKFIKLNIDYRKIHPINSNTTLAYRINGGITNPYSDNQVLPYEKYFFAGGSNGIRAWRPRRLGPGSYVRIDSTDNLVSYDFEQQGEILLEGSIELRKNLIGFLDYAFFIDFGNIWTIDRDPSRPGARFEVDSFLNEIAVGGGAGLRFDFSFLVLRLDAGVKIYD